MSRTTTTRQMLISTLRPTAAGGNNCLESIQWQRTHGSAAQAKGHTIHTARNPHSTPFNRQQSTAAEQVRWQLPGRHTGIPGPRTKCGQIALQAVQHVSHKIRLAALPAAAATATEVLADAAAAEARCAAQAALTLGACRQPGSAHEHKVVPGDCGRGVTEGRWRFALARIVGLQ